MKRFMDEGFLLNNETGAKLYNDFAKEMPIFDYHCHLNPKEIADNKKYRNMTEIWLGEDHYKWRALRANGIEEKYITGASDDKEKFLKWAETMPCCIGNPLYHWTHLELKRFFGIDKTLSPETAEEIWEKCNEMLQTDEFSARNLIKRSNVKVICTTDDPLDSLEYHAAIAADKTFDVRVLPAFRPDNGINIEKDGFSGWIKRLSEVAGLEVKSLNDFKNALLQRIKFFHSMGCRLSDHGLEPIVYEKSSEQDAAAVFEKALIGKKLSIEDIKKYKTFILLFLAEQYTRLGWTMQIHIGCIRNTNKTALKQLGFNMGFDTIDDSLIAEPLAKLLDNINEICGLPKTILYCLNPRDNEVVASMAGCFQDSETPSKVQFGSAWWYSDQKNGIIKQMTVLANIGLLGRFVGMLTDSRSFLSYTRHEYFRRILCNLIGDWVENGEAPDDMSLLGNMIRDICFNNAKRYFGFDTFDTISD